VPDPYFNEPGWEYERGTPRGASQSKAYNQKIRRYTISAAIEPHLSSILSNTNQYAEFESIICRHFLEKRYLIQKELWSWVKDDPGLVSSVNNVCSLFEQLAKRERGTRSRRNRGISAMAKKATESNEPIVLDDSDVEETYQSRSKKPSNGALKSDETIEIDLSGDEEEDETSDGAKNTGCDTGVSKSDGGLIDLT